MSTTRPPLPPPPKPHRILEGDVGVDATLAIALALFGAVCILIGVCIGIIAAGS